MSQQQEQFTPEEGEPAKDGNVRQQQAQEEGHAGRGSDSAMQHMREWEQRRASHSGGKRRQGPD